MNIKDDIDFCSMYLNWIKENIEQHEIRENIFRITLPFFDKDNDHIEIYIIKKDDDSYYMTDDGETLRNLQLSGFEISSSNRRKQIFYSILYAHGVSCTDDNELFIECTLSDLPQKKHMLSQCMIKVSDMFSLSKPNVKSLFLEDVQNYLDDNDIRYTSNFSVTGKSKLQAHYDFSIGGRRGSSKFIKVVNKIDSNMAKSIIFAWGDTIETRNPESQLYTFIQDKDKKVSPDAIEALKQYNIRPALWSKKEQYIDELSA